MGVSATDVDRRRAVRSRPKRSLGSLLVQGVGELLITLGIVLVLFVVWQLWWTNIDSNRQQREAVSGLFQEFEAPLEPVPDAEDSFGDPAVLQPVADGATFGVVYIPRFGDSYSRPVTGGVSDAVLDNLGLGHYPDTAMPGDVGNFALAGHRQTHGQVLDAIHTLVPGDSIYVQTAQGYYRYVYRNHEIVMPDRVDVIAPVPTEPGAEPRERLLTLTSCNPRFGAQERYIAYAAMESWRPLSAGPPEEIAAQVARNAGQSAGTGEG